MEEKQSKPIKGGKREGAGRPAGIPNKSTTLAREAIARFVDGNSHKLQEWLEAIAEDPKYGPKYAFDCFMQVAEYHVPKLARTEHTGSEDKPIRYVVTWKK
jgi:hypothetical protein